MIYRRKSLGEHSEEEVGEVDLELEISDDTSPEHSDTAPEYNPFRELTNAVGQVEKREILEALHL